MPSDSNKPINDTIAPLTIGVLLSEAKLIAQGGMAEIYSAFQPSLDRPIVIKKLKIELSTNPDAVMRFRREAKALASVLHQNVAHVYDYVERAEEPYILMEFIDGLDLSTVIERVGHLPANIAAAVMLGVAKGVGYMHTHNLIHRDIKPSNIRLTPRGEVKVMDFGIVMDLDAKNLTRPGLLVGSPSYLSPEQVLGDPIGPKADIFLMGICLYETVTGTRPFKEEERKTVFQNIRDVNYISAKKMQPTLPAALNRIVDKCLQKNPKDRYRSSKEFILDLEKFLGTNSRRTEDLLLEYLDEEALLKPLVPYERSDEAKPAAFKYGKKIAFFTAFVLVAFGCGYFIARLLR